MSSDSLQENRRVLSFHYDCMFTHSVLEDFDNSTQIHRCAPYKLGAHRFGLRVVKEGSCFQVCLFVTMEDPFTSQKQDKLIFPVDEADITAINSIPGRNYSRRCSRPFMGTHEFMYWSSNSVDDLDREGWLDKHGVMQFRVHLTLNVDACQRNLTSQWDPQACVNKLWQDREYTDFGIVVQGNHELRCHRAVLSAASPVFKQMFSGNWEETLQTLERPDVSIEEMSLLLEYIYLGHLRIDVNATDLISVAQLADYYQLPELVDQCTSRIPPLVNEANVVEVLCRLRLLSKTIPKFKILLNSAVEEMKNDAQLLWQVVENLSSQKASCSAQVDTAENPARTLFSMSTSPTLVKHTQEEKPCGGCGVSKLADYSQSATPTPECLSVEHASFAPPPGLSAGATPYSSQEASCQSHASFSDEDIVDRALSVESLTQAGEKFDREERTQASPSDGHAEPCQQRGGPRRKTRRGRGAAKSRNDRGQADLNSIPDTYTSWD